MKIDARFVVDDRVLRALIAKSARWPASGKVGFNAPSKEHPYSGKSMAEIATVLEYGSDLSGIPARPFMKKTMREHSMQIDSLMAMAWKKIIKGADSVPALKAVCEMVVRWMKETMGDGSYAPLSTKSTIPRRRTRKAPPPNMSTTPLIDTGVLRENISAKVRRGRVVKE